MILIVPEILHEIRQSRFLVLDTTYPNNGAYYEAGYAMGIGKEVIACCKKSEFKDNVHFDIAQKNLVIWENIDDLKNRLTKRIEATIS